MRAMSYLIQRELGDYLRATSGYLIMAAALMVDGLLFNAWAVGSTQRPSSQVLEVFFYCVSGTTVLASILISMRLIAEERQNGTWALLATSPLTEAQVVLGKFWAAWIYLGVMTGLTVHMPLLVALHGKIAWGHIAVGYLGLMLLGAACIAIGLLCSALAPSQLVAAIFSAATIGTFILLWLLSRIASPPLADVIAYLSLHDRHFRPFMRGIVSLSDVVFYLSLTYVALTAATRALEARRWQ
jgi:ABC-2 type transport system permease protein